jgi:membrane dipeptidase
MGKIKKYDGYKSWDFLEPGVDFEPYEVEPQLDRVKTFFKAKDWDFSLSKDQEDHVKELMDNNIAIALHEHLNVFPLSGSHRRLRIYKAFQGLAASGIDIVFEGGANPNGPFHTNETINYLGMSQADYAHQNLIKVCHDYADIEEALKGEKIALILSVEHLATIGHEIDMLDLYYGLGLRQAGIVAFFSNTLGVDKSEHMDSGLSDFGYDCVKRMNKIGLMPELSHSSDQTAIETIEASDKPIIISHAGSRELFYNVRMFPDEILKQLAEKGGVIGVEIAGFAPRTKKHPDATIECMLDHIYHLMEVLGPDHVGIGADTFFGDHAEMYKTGGGTALKMPSAQRQHNPALPPKLNTYDLRAVTPPAHPFCEGFESPGDFRNIVKGMIRDGYSDAEIAKVMGQNALRVIKKWFK